MHLLSIVIATCYSSAYIQRAFSEVMDVLSAKGLDFEILVVYDGGDTATKSVVLHFKKLTANHLHRLTSACSLEKKTEYFDMKQELKRLFKEESYPEVIIRANKGEALLEQSIREYSQPALSA
jgi:hypothetical protein